MQIISDHSKVDKEKWSEFVYNHQNGNIFHTPEMFQVYHKTKRFFPVLYIAFNYDEVIGVFVGVIQKEFKGLLGFLSSRCIVFGGPLVKNDNPEIINQLLQAHNKKAKNKVIYTQFRNLFYIKNLQSVFEKNGYKYEPHLNIHVDLNQVVESFWTSLKSKLRQNIRKADKNKIQFKFIDSIDELKEAYFILKKIYSNARLPLPDITLFLSAFDLLRNKNMIAFFKAEKDGVIIGCRFVLLYKNMIYDWYTGSKKEFYKYNPNDFLPYKVIEWGMLQWRYTLFDFGGAGKPGVKYGVRDHKLKFGSNVVEYGRFEKIHKPFLYYLAKKSFKIWQSL